MEIKETKRINTETCIIKNLMFGLVFAVSFLLVVNSIGLVSAVSSGELILGYNVGYIIKIDDADSPILGYNVDSATRTDGTDLSYGAYRT